MEGTNADSEVNFRGPLRHAGRLRRIHGW
jgi:hypothetical protein